MALLHNESWAYSGTPLEVVNNFNYLSTVFNYTEALVLNQETLFCNGLNALSCLLYI